MISIEKGILISGRRGSKVWNQLMRENIQQVIRTLHDTELFFYCNDKWSFFFTAEPEYPDDKFLEQAEMAFHECGYYFCKELNITAVNAFLCCHRRNRSAGKDTALHVCHGRPQCPLLSVQQG